MKNRDDGGAAFPCQTFDVSGMTLRDYFAAKTIPVAYNAEPTYKKIAEEAYKVADAMLEARKK